MNEETKKLLFERMLKFVAYVIDNAEIHEPEVPECQVMKIRLKGKIYSVFESGLVEEQE